MSVQAAIHDRGYRGYDGPREGRSLRLRALFTAGLRRALGLRRPWRAKVVPWALVSIAFAPALFVLASVLIGTANADSIGSYGESLRAGSLLVVVLSAVVATELVCRDRRDAVFSLLFSRPLTPLEYFAARLGVAVAVTAAVTFVPLATMYVARAASAPESAAYIADHPWAPLQLVAAAAVVSVFYSAVTVGVAAMFDRRGLAIVSILVLFVVASLAVETAAALPGPGWRWFATLDPVAVPQRVADSILGEPTERGVAGGGAAAAAAAGAFVAAASTFTVRRLGRAAR